jgi:hypothetical protein
MCEKDLASADPSIGSDIEPCAKVLFAWPAAHIQTDFGEDPSTASKPSPGSLVRSALSFAQGDDAGVPAGAFRQSANGSGRVPARSTV